MKQIYQTFDLKLNSEGWVQGDKTGEQLSEDAKALRESILEKGYVFLESNTRFGGLAHSVIIAGNINSNIMSDFRDITSKLGLEYEAGAFYVPKTE